MMERKEHWEKVYQTKQPNEVSWTQEVPKISLNFIKSFNLPKSAAIIDIGGGDSKLADFLLEEGYENITVLDISEQALERAKERLGEKAAKINWIVSDITEFKPTNKYDLWHDRATFHFLTTDAQVQQYRQTVNNAVKGYMVIGTFSDNGPSKCSGLDTRQYNEETMKTVFSEKFERTPCIIEDHITPFDTAQNFIFCGFKRRED